MPTQTPAGHGPQRSQPDAATHDGNTRGHVAGELPTHPQAPVPRSRGGAERGGYAADRGELPLDPQQRPDRSRPGLPRQRGSANAHSTQESKRTRVNLSDPGKLAPVAAPREPVEQPEQHDEEPADGLSMFNLGSVPASVTPPRTWRKAAWFAAASSGGVMGLLFAGSFLLGQQPAQPQAVGEWTYLNRHDAPSLLERDNLPGPTHQAPAQDEPTERTTGTPPSSSTTPSSGASDTPTRSARSGTSGSTATTAPTSAGSSAATASRTTRATTTTRPPEKPPPSPARTTVVEPRPLYTQQRDVSAMAANSQEYLNTVTENPQRAHQLTTGELRAKGPDGLRRMYADVAYFEVRQVAVNESRGVTVNTVKAVYKDGHTQTEKHTLTFDGNGKIARASR